MIVPSAYVGQCARTFPYGLGPPDACRWPSQVPPFASLFVPLGQIVFSQRARSKAPCRLALRKLALVRMAPIREAPCRLAAVRLAPVRLGPTRRQAPSRRQAPRMLALIRVAPVRLAFVSRAPVRSTLVRS